MISHSAGIPCLFLVNRTGKSEGGYFRKGSQSKNHFSKFIFQKLFFKFYFLKIIFFKLFSKSTFSGHVEKKNRSKHALITVINPSKKCMLYMSSMVIYKVALQFNVAPYISYKHCRTRVPLCAPKIAAPNLFSRK